MRRLLLPALALALAAPAAAQQTVWPDEGPATWPVRPTEAAITANDLRVRLYQYAHDSMMGREAGTFGNIKATDYVAAEFKRLGLIPAGENGGYFQNIGYGPSGFEEATLALMVAGGELALRSAWLPLPPGLGGDWSMAFRGRDLPVVFGGRWGDETPLDPALIAGKAVLFLPPADRPGRFFATTDPRAAGARVVLVAALDATTGLANFALRTRNGLHLDPVAGAPAGAALSDSAAAALFDAPLTSLAVGAAGKTISGRWIYTQGSTEYPVRNVLGILPGSDPALKGQFVVVGAHNDHVGMDSRGGVDHDSLRAFNTVLKPQGANDRVALDAVTPAQWAEINGLIAAARTIRPAQQDTIFNGADDDGSGTVVMLEIAERMVAGERPRRSILFNSHAAEEKGLLGSRWWTQHPTVPLDSIVAAHNMDMLGKGRVSDVMFGGPRTVQMLGSRRVSLEFGDMIDSLNAVRDEAMAIDYSWDRTNRLNRFCRSDQVNYIRAGIPTTYFSTGYSRDYHQLTDEARYINFELTGRVARFVHDIALTAANRTERLALLPADEQDPEARCGG